MFDGDNTLWHIESLYDQARQNLVRFVERLGANANHVEGFQRSEDKRLFSVLGYSAERFATSFRHTLIKFFPNATEADLAHVSNMAYSVFDSPAVVDPDAPIVLGTLKLGYRLALLTAGERWVQQRRLNTFAFLRCFDFVQIVKRKNIEVFQTLVRDLDLSPEMSWVVGDSLRSDAIPALQAGLNAILVANHNWVEVERDDYHPHKLRVVDRLREVPEVIAESDVGIPVLDHS